MTPKLSSKNGAKSTSTNMLTGFLCEKTASAILDAHPKDDRVGKATRQHILLAQEFFDEDAYVQGIELVVANKEDGAVRWKCIQAPHHCPILTRGKEDRADKAPQ